MLKSMTGFGKAFCDYGNKKIVIEIKSLNSKQMDVSTHISSLYREKDMMLRNIISKRLNRGKVDFSLYIEDSSDHQTPKINQKVVSDYYNQLHETASQFNQELPTNWLEMVLRLPDVLKAENTVLDEKEWDAVLELLDKAFEQIDLFRIQEGAALQKMFETKIATISSLLLDIEKYEEERIDKIKSRLEENLKKLEDRIKIDRNRLEQEMIYYLEKLDVNEEKVRLRNHLNYFLETIKEPNSGKKLNFITQEMGREINTLGSKSNNSDMQIVVVQMKDELEQIKEQILNVL